MVTAVLFPRMPIEVLAVEQGKPLVKSLNGEPMQLRYTGGKGWTLVDWRFVNREDISAICQGDIAETEEFQNWRDACADVDFLADEHRPETTAAASLEDFALTQLIEMMEQKQVTK